MNDKTNNPPTNDQPGGGGRRDGDRRKAQVPIAGPDRRKDDRRSGTDRRTAPRADLAPDES